MLHFGARFKGAGGRLVFGTRLRHCCSAFPTCRSPGSVPAMLGLFRGPWCDFKLVCTFQEDASPGISTAGVVAGINVADASASDYRWRRLRAVFVWSWSRCWNLLLFSSQVCRATPSTAFNCLMQAEARGPLLQGSGATRPSFSCEEIRNSGGKLFCRG